MYSCQQGENSHNDGAKQSSLLRVRRVKNQESRMQHRKDKLKPKEREGEEQGV